MKNIEEITENLSAKTLEVINDLEQYIYDHPESLFSVSTPKPKRWADIHRVYLSSGMICVDFETWSGTLDRFEVCIETFLKNNL